MYTSLYADAAVARLAEARPLLIDVLPARDGRAPSRRGRRLPRRTADRAGGDVPADAGRAGRRAALSRASGPRRRRRWRSPRPARSPLLPNHDAGGVGPMSGIVTGSMPVMVARDAASGTEAWCNLNEGSGKVLRYGADDAEVVARLQWMRDVLGPALAAALARSGPLDLIESSVPRSWPGTSATTARMPAPASCTTRCPSCRRRSPRSSSATTSSSSTSRCSRRRWRWTPRRASKARPWSPRSRATAWRWA